MTNQIVPRRDDSIDASIRSLAPTGGGRRPVKLIEHPAFRNSPTYAARQAAMQASFIVVPVRVVSLNAPVAPADCRSSAAA